MQDEVKVSQADREAAASCVSNRKAKREIIDGVWDESSTVQAFARHRHQAERDTLARMEPVAWMYEKNGKVLIDHGPTCSDDMVSGGWTATPLYALPPAPEAGQ